MLEVFKDVPYNAIYTRRPFYSFESTLPVIGVSQTEEFFKTIGRTYVYIESIDFKTDLPEDVYNSILRQGKVPQLNFKKRNGQDLYNFKPIKLLNYRSIPVNFGFMVDNTSNQNLLVEYTPDWVVSPQIVEYGANTITTNISINYSLTTYEPFIKKFVQGM